MKIIKEAPPSDWSAKKQCTGGGSGGGGCGAELLVEAEDLRTTEINAMRRTDSIAVVFRCPCGVVTQITNPPDAALQIAKKNGPIA